jgi:hypothetical protein
LNLRFEVKKISNYDAGRVIEVRTFPGLKRETWGTHFRADHEIRRLTQFERCECEQGEDEGENPEADDDLGFAPA